MSMLDAAVHCGVLVTVFVLSLTTANNVSSKSSDDKIPIYLGGFFAYTGAWASTGVLPAVEMALEHINARPDILADYDLRMVWNDSGVSILLV